MRKVLFAFILLFVLPLTAQNKISGTLSPADQFQWIIAYRIKPGTQVYVADTVIKNGEFSLSLPESATPGTYRLVYAVPQEEYNFDILYSGKEDIELTFSLDHGVAFKSSKENLIFNSYFNEIAKIEQEIISYYTQENNSISKLEALSKELETIQKSYELKSKNLLAYDFIKANSPFIPSKTTSIQGYVHGKKSTYFNHLNLANTNLQASSFLTNKIANYVFTALPLDVLSEEKAIDEHTKNLATVHQKSNHLNEKYQLHLYYSLWTQAVAMDMPKVADVVYENYLKPLCLALENQEIIDYIEVYNRLRIGSKAPELEWNHNGIQKKLSTLEGANTYVVVFWSSGCGHCLRELPALHKELINNSEVKVIAVGLEDDDISWKREVAKMNNFEHVLSLGKWESDYANLYDIHQTPSYFLLDKNKIIYAKPEDDKAVVEYLRNN